MFLKLKFYFHKGWLADYYGNWYASFLLTGVAFTCAGVTALLEDCVIRFGTNKTYSLEKVERNSLEKDRTKSPENIEIELVSRGSIL